MPNHVHTHLLVEGPKDALGALVTFVAGRDSKGQPEPFDFDRILPMPPGILRLDVSGDDLKRCPGRNWLDWSTRVWGTKWSAYGQVGPEVEFASRSVVFRFTTAWNLACPVYLELSRLFPELQVTATAVCERLEWARIERYLKGNAETVFACMSPEPDAIPLLFRAAYELVHGESIDEYLSEYERELEEEAKR